MSGRALGLGWIPQLSTGTEKALRVGEGPKEREMPVGIHLDCESSPTPGPNMEMIGQRQSRKLPPHKPLLWQVTHSESTCVFFHMYAASNKCFYLFHNFGLFAEFFQRRQESRFFFLPTFYCQNPSIKFTVGLHPKACKPCTFPNPASKPEKEPGIGKRDISSVTDEGPYMSEARSWSDTPQCGADSG